jgi:predicted nucleic-acid-binding protein
VIGLDTNILVRFLMVDDPAQSARAARVMETLSEEEPGFVSVVVLAETVWVLDRFYRQDRATIADVVQELLSSDSLALEHSAAVAWALGATRDQGADFADALIGAIAAEAGCERTLTFDRRAARLPGFTLA